MANRTCARATGAWALGAAIAIGMACTATNEDFGPGGYAGSGGSGGAGGEPEGADAAAGFGGIDAASEDPRGPVGTSCQDRATPHALNWTFAISA